MLSIVLLRGCLLVKNFYTIKEKVGKYKKENRKSMKKTYAEPKIDVMTITDEDIIQTSGEKLKFTPADYSAGSASWIDAWVNNF